ncbi:MAG: DNA modification system-associated small protein [Nonlabens sp.]
MSKKGLDTLFVHYGIRKEDMQVIETLCTRHDIDFDWLKEDVLKTYHEKKIKNEELDEKSLIKLLEKSLHKLK